MIYLFTALYCEAQPLIRYFGMEKEITDAMPFQVFGNPEAELCLTVTGPGGVAAAAAVSSTCTAKKAGAKDHLVNIGTCGVRAGTGQPGTLYLCNKITEEATGRTFYPDLLFRHDFCEAAVRTRVKPYRSRAQAAGLPAEDVLYDMEAAAVYQAGAYYAGPHQMHFLKLVSDSGAPDSVRPDQVGTWLQLQMEKIDTYFTQLRESSRSAGTAAGPKMAQMQVAAARLEKDLCCSRTMYETLKQHLRYCVLAGLEYEPAVSELYRSGRLPCTDRKEGKKCLEDLKRKLL